jgi:two-component system, chemotaxis family, response regulator Rcp1
MADILLIEDNPADVMLTIEAFKECTEKHNVSTVKDGIEALKYLYNENEYINAQRPDLILLDLNLPRKDGREVLSIIKSDEDLRDIPVLILSTSKNEEDIMRCYKLKANSYITKPVDLHQFIEILKSIEKFWLTVVQLPKYVNK